MADFSRKRLKKTEKEWLKEIEKSKEKADARREGCNQPVEYSSSSEDDMIDYWLPDDTETKKEEAKTSKKEAKGPKGAEIDQDKKMVEDKRLEQLKASQDNEDKEVNQAKDTTNNNNSKRGKPKYTHFLHFPLFNCERFSNRVNNFRKDILKMDLKYEPLVDIGQPHLTILPLDLTDI